MTKEEKIKEAYDKHWETVREYVDENGWCNAFFSLRDGFFYFHNEECGKDLWRPISLRGIENNNGWIVIDKVKDLPTTNQDEMHFVMVGGSISTASFRDIRKWNNVLGIFTHYQPITKPNPPIY